MQRRYDASRRRKRQILPLQIRRWHSASPSSSSLIRLLKRSGGVCTRSGIQTSSCFVDPLSTLQRLCLILSLVSTDQWYRPIWPGRLTCTVYFSVERLQLAFAKAFCRDVFFVSRVAGARIQSAMLYTAKNIRISTDILRRVFHISTEPVPYTLYR